MLNARYIVVLTTVALMCPTMALAQRGRQDKPQGPPVLSAEYLERLGDQLELKGKQKEKVESVVKNARPGIKKKWDELQALQKRIEALSKKLHNSMREVQEKIREQLDYEQKERFDEMRMRQKQRGMRRSQRPPRRGRRPEPREFPPERFEMDIPGNRSRDLPPELQERIRERQRRRMDMEPGYQRDLPPVEEWNDGHRRLFNDDPREMRPDDDE